MNFSIGDPIFSEAMACVFPIWQMDQPPQPQTETAAGKTLPVVSASVPGKIQKSWNGLRIFFPAALLAVYLLLRYFIAWSPMHKPSFRFLESGFFTGGLFAAVVFSDISSGKTVWLPLICAAVASLTFYLLQGTQKRGCLWALPVITALLFLPDGHSGTLGEFFPLLAALAAVFMDADVRRYNPVMEDDPANAVRLTFFALAGISLGIVYVTLVPDWSSRTWWYWCYMFLPFILIAFLPRFSLKKS